MVFVVEVLGEDSRPLQQQPLFPEGAVPCTLCGVLSQRDATGWWRCLSIQHAGVWAPVCDNCFEDTPGTTDAIILAERELRNRLKRIVRESLLQLILSQ